ncbi:MAG TPA: tRNA pseudouridine(13) synthase TruD [Candidatus Nanoarchaeia archaeon]|nr:tRNA pseudouridine(13) synthase TruD [Candidatus Nanoarchaeia archaeon]
MNLRQKPDDFIVEEIPLHELKTEGRYAVYKLQKVGMTTFAAEKVLAAHCNVQFKQIGFAGLKDAHARTTQYFSVDTTKPELGNFKERNVTSELVGFLDQQLRTGDLKGNSFIITVRELEEKDIETVEKNVEQVALGIPNYFDSQRFGSLKGVDGFIAKDVLKGNYEAAVKKIITATTRHQKATIRNIRKFILSNWGKWDICFDEVKKQGLERTVEGTVVIHLANDPADFKGAFRRTFKGIREIFFSAYQSYIWNECIKQLVRQNSKEVYSVPYEAGKLVFPRKWNEGEKLGTFPLVAPDVKGTSEQMQMLANVLKIEKMTLPEFATDEHILVPRQREVVVVPQDLEIEVGDDELNKRKKKIVLAFSLPKGAYATIVTKSLFGQ